MPERYTYTPQELQKTKKCPFCGAPHFDITFTITFKRCGCGAEFKQEFNEEERQTKLVWVKE